MPRPIFQIAKEIKASWPTLSPHAAPYLDAMMELDSITDMFWADTGKSIVSYFLSNADYWRGPDARRIKAELKELLS
jgi:hypothetical protein